MDELEKKWDHRMLKDYTCLLVWGSQETRKTQLMQDLLQNRGDQSVYSISSNTVRGLSRDLSYALQRDPDFHRNIIIEITTKLPEYLQQELANFIQAKREHNTNIYIITDSLDKLGSTRYSLDIVFHLLPTEPTTSSRYQKLVNKANETGILVTNGLNWVSKANPELMADFEVLGVYEF